MIEVPTGSISGMTYPMPARGGDDPKPDDQPVEEDENTSEEEDNE